MPDPEAILVVTTGGTIDKVYFDAKSDYTIGDSEFEELAGMAGLQAPYRLVSVLRKDSLEVTDTDRQLVLDAIEGAAENRILITHGTDTMAETARLLEQAKEKIAGKTIVLTGAMQPSRMRASDAPFNLGFALGVIQAMPAGVYLAMHGQIFSPASVRKNRDAGRFEKDAP
jgi:L-asparaginase